MELWTLEVHVRKGILYTAHAQRAVFFIFDRLYPMTHVSSGNKASPQLKIKMNVFISSFYATVQHILASEALRL